VPRTRVLVTGATGLLGGRLAVLLGRSFEVTAAVHESAAPEGLSAVALDLASPGSIKAAVEAARPEAIVHAGAWADADRCERDVGGARAINVDGTRIVAEECRGRGLRLVVLSTDLVFAGGEGARAEGDAASPRQVYGRTKLVAEEEALRGCAGSAVVRVALVFGRGYGRRGTSSESVAWALRRGQPLRLFTDQFRTPVDAESVTQAVAALLRGQGAGVYHLGGPERVSRFELGQRVASVLGLDPGPIEPSEQARLSGGAPRPGDVSLDSSRARRELGFAPGPLDDGIRAGRPEGPPV
jgi:dTDP-4-dehydrorhamnose reductase